MKATLRGIRRTIGAACEQEAPATADVVRAMLKHCRTDTLLEGYVFRAVARGRAADAPLTPQVVALRVKRIAQLAGLDAAQFPGHSLRAGFCTSAAEHGANLLRIMDVTRHKSVDVLRGYVWRVDSFKDHAGAGFL